MTDTTTPARIFKIGANTVVEDESTCGLTVEQAHGHLRHAFPEVAHATVRERVAEDGTLVVEFLPQPGRKG